jgi:hypothetical protein
MKRLSTKWYIREPCPLMSLLLYMSPYCQAQCEQTNRQCDQHNFHLSKTISPYYYSKGLFNPLILFLALSFFKSEPLLSCLTYSKILKHSLCTEEKLCLASSYKNNITDRIHSAWSWKKLLKKPATKQADLLS